MTKKGSEEEKIEEQPEETQDYEALAHAARIGRGREATEKINAVLEEYKCTMVPVVTITGTQIRTSIEIVPQ